MNKEVVYDFVNAICEQSIDKIYALMTDNHKFIDANGNEVVGKDKMIVEWKVYFQWFPNYKIEITDIFANGNTLAVFGFASATFKGNQTDKEGNYWRLPASWRIVVENSKIKLWQVYADTKIPFDIIQNNK